LCCGDDAANLLFHVINERHLQLLNRLGFPEPNRPVFRNPRRAM
jgi:hypothetical protein